MSKNKELVNKILDKYIINHNYTQIYYENHTKYDIMMSYDTVKKQYSKFLKTMKLDKEQFQFPISKSIILDKIKTKEEDLLIEQIDLIKLKLQDKKCKVIKKKIEYNSYLYLISNIDYKMNESNLELVSANENVYIGYSMYEYLKKYFKNNAKNKMLSKYSIADTYLFQPQTLIQNNIWNSSFPAPKTLGIINQIVDFCSKQKNVANVSGNQPEWLENILFLK